MKLLLFLIYGSSRELDRIISCILGCHQEQDAEKYKLGHPSLFHYLNQSKTYELDGVSNSEEYLKTRRAMDIVGISSEDQVKRIIYFI